MKRIAISIALVLLLIGALWTFWPVAAEPTAGVTHGAPANRTPNAQVPAQTGRAANHADSPRDEPERSSSAREAFEARRAAIGARRAQRERQNQQHERELGREEPAQNEAASPRRGRLPPEYIQGAVAELQPLMSECYDIALSDWASRNEMPFEGRLLTSFVLSAEPGVGGVVEDVEILEGPGESVLSECFQQTLYTLELPDPPEGGSILVRYPFQLRAGEEDVAP